MAASVVIIGGLLLGSIGLHKTLHENYVFTTRYSDQRRLIDCLSRDLRRAVFTAATDPSGLPTPVIGKTVTVDESGSLIFTMPGYYRSNVPTETDYDQAYSVIATEEGVEYGDASGSAPAVNVWMKKMYVPEEGCVCFVRKEGETTQVIVRDAATLSISAQFAADGKSCEIAARFVSPVRGHEEFITTFDHVLLRNSDVETAE
jgi:hypothetical protein